MKKNERNKKRSFLLKLSIVSPTLLEKSNVSECNQWNILEALQWLLCVKLQCEMLFLIISHHLKCLSILFHHSCRWPGTGCWGSRSQTWHPATTRRRCRLTATVRPKNTATPCTVEMIHTHETIHSSCLCPHAFTITGLSFLLLLVLNGSIFSTDDSFVNVLHY